MQSPDRQLVASPFLKSRRRKTTLPGEGNQAVAVIAFALLALSSPELNKVRMDDLYIAGQP